MGRLSRRREIQKARAIWPEVCHINSTAIFSYPLVGSTCLVKIQRTLLSTGMGVEHLYKSLFCLQSYWCSLLPSLNLLWYVQSGSDRQWDEESNDDNKSLKLTLQKWLTVVCVFYGWNYLSGCVNHKKRKFCYGKPRAVFTKDLEQIFHFCHNFQSKYLFKYCIKQSF